MKYNNSFKINMVISLLNSNEQNTGEDKKHQGLTFFF